MKQRSFAHSRRDARLAGRLSHRTVEVMVALVLTLATAVILIATLSG
jgi:hypothetical protein